MNGTEAPSHPPHQRIPPVVFLILFTVRTKVLIYHFTLWGSLQIIFQPSLWILNWGVLGNYNLVLTQFPFLFHFHGMDRTILMD